MAMWAIFAAPLLMSNNLRRIPKVRWLYVDFRLCTARMWLPFQCMVVYDDFRFNVK